MNSDIKIIDRTPERVLAIAMFLIAIVSVYSAISFSHFALTAVPLAFAVFVLVWIKPEIGLGSVFVGLVFFGLIISAMGIEKPIAPFGLMGIVSAFSIGLLILRDGGSLPKKLNPIIVSVIAMLALYFFNLPRAVFPSYVIPKTAILIVNCAIPFFMLQVLKAESETFEKAVRFSLLIALFPALFFLAMFVTQSSLAQMGRFNAVELVNINVVARNIGYTALISIWAFFSARKTASKIAFASLAVILVLIIIATGSRTALAATAFGTIFFTAFFSKLPIPKRFFLILLACVSIFIFMQFGIGGMMRRLTNLQYIDLSVAGRYAMWREAWEHIGENVLFGLGTGNFSKILPAWALGAKLHHPHNIVIEYFIEWGIIGIAVMIFLLTSPIIVWLRMRKSERYSSQTKELSNLFFTLFVFTLVNGLADASSVDPQLFTTLGIISALYIREKEVDLEFKS